MYDYTESKHEELSLRAYNLAIGLIVIYGIAINVLMCKFCAPIFINWNHVALYVGCFIVGVIGVIISNRDDRFFPIFIGYNLVVLACGVLLSLSLGSGAIDRNSIMNGLVVTSIAVIVMILLASIVPHIFLSIMRKALIITLGVNIICEILLICIGIYTSALWDIIVALLFCAYLGYEWAMAQSKPHTLANAMYAVVGLYLDIINIFLRTTSASAKSKKK